MYAISVTGGPKRPSMILAFCLVVLAAILLGGCDTRMYRKVPMCDMVPPPTPARYVDATPDEQTVLMTDAYIGQIKATSECNDNIQLINASNKAE